MRLAKQILAKEFLLCKFQLIVTNSVPFQKVSPLFVIFLLSSTCSCSFPRRGFRRLFVLLIILLLSCRRCCRCFSPGVSSRKRGRRGRTRFRCCQGRRRLCRHGLSDGCGRSQAGYTRCAAQRRRSRTSVGVTLALHGGYTKRRSGG